MAVESPILPLEHSAKKPALWPFFVFGIVLLGLFWLATKWMIGGSVGNTDPEEAARSAQRVKNLEELRAEDAAKLNSYEWVDRAKGEVRIPIDVAKSLIVTRLRESEPRPAYPVQAAPAPTANDAAPVQSPVTPDANPATPAAPADDAQPAPATP
ncbi:MAG: hypothetical protein SFU53_08970 [Terrimicrobiaceae bacterium]|nr:hypothetical protein [Terrimicrobiaceae bacterium]